MLSKRLTLAAGLILISLAAFAQSSMTDQQVLDYIEQGVAEGKSQSDIIKELSLKGVDRNQAMRVRSLYQKERGANAASTQIQDIPRVHTVNEAKEAEAEDGGEAAPITAMSSTAAPEQVIDVYGRDIFRNRSLNFSPSENLATPKNYRLGPGDEVIIDIFGANQSTIRSTISPEGSINVDVLGPLYISGMTIDEANSYLKKRLARIYAGLNRSSAGTDIRLTLGQIRTIQVNILSNVGNPGTYRLSAFSTVFHALYMAGGVVDPGTLRNIKVNRSGKIVGNVDVYDYLQNGSLESDIRLEEGDVILVPPYEVMVKLSGMVKRPMYFEMKNGETLKDLFNYAGGFANGAYTDNVTVTRQTGKTYEVKTVANSDFGKFKLQDGDEVEVGKLQSRFENKLAIFGAVYQPGSYELSANVHNVKQLIEAAGGLLPEAYMGRVVVHREHEDRSMEVISGNLGKIMDGSASDIELENNDEVHIASAYELKEQGTMSIEGLVVNPGVFPYAANTSVQDLIVLAGGLLDGASTARIDINRRTLDSDGTVATKEIAEVFSISLKNGLVEDGGEKFIIEPYDEVVVHRSPTYNVQKHVTIDGEVNFPGTYSMTEREERLSDLVKKAGGANDFAFLKGARLFRQRSEAEQRQLDDEINNLMVQGDTTSVRLLETSKTYSVSVNLQDAVDNPGGKEDIILREGDRLEIPLSSNTVRVSGAVMVPNAFAYNPRYSARKYVELSGGFAQRAKRNHAYIISMNGAAKPYTPSSRLKPGDEIVVPQKEKKNSDSITRLASGIGNTVSGLASMVAAVAILVRYIGN